MSEISAALELFDIPFATRKLEDYLEDRRNLRHESTARADHRRRAEQPRVAAANPQGGIQPLLCQRGEEVGRRGASRAGTYPAGRAHARHGWLRGVPPAQGRSGSCRDPGALYHRERQRRQRARGSRRAEWIISTNRSVRARCVPGCAIISPWCASISSSAAIAPPSSC